MGMLPFQSTNYVASSRKFSLNIYKYTQVFRTPNKCISSMNLGFCTPCSVSAVTVP